MTPSIDYIDFRTNLCDGPLGYKIWPSSLVCMVCENSAWHGCHNLRGEYIYKLYIEDQWTDMLKIMRP